MERDAVQSQASVIHHSNIRYYWLTLSLARLPRANTEAASLTFTDCFAVTMRVVYIEIVGII